MTEEGVLAAVGTQNIDFLVRKCLGFQGTSGGQTSCVDTFEAQTLVFLQEIFIFSDRRGYVGSMEAQNIDFPAGK